LIFITRELLERFGSFQSFSAHCVWTDLRDWWQPYHR